ncbi:MAG: hypothetical protein M1832_001860 [Thelocarpon impressellum]|nr:MAG: hypothetical protein M1832_001860 [Thelocarpon impressellum]
MAPKDDNTQSRQSTNGVVANDSKKRKSPPSYEAPRKAPRRSTRKGAPSAADNEDGPTTAQLLTYLLQPASDSTTLSPDEAAALSSSPPSKIYATTSTLSPFEELLSALVLSRPLSHRLGQRTIRTLLNPPHSLTSPAAIRAGGKQGVREALEAARTQHRQRTSSQIVALADAVATHLSSSADDTSLEKVRAEPDLDAQRTLLKSSIKGLGPIGLDIFFRRVQAAWPSTALYPFIDARTRVALEKIGLPAEPHALARAVNEVVDGSGKGDVKGFEREEGKKRAFVRVLERAVGAELEGNAEAAREGAAAPERSS